jgi:hypothetical protein
MATVSTPVDVYKVPGSTSDRLHFRFLRIILEIICVTGFFTAKVNRRWLAFSIKMLEFYGEWYSVYRLPVIIIVHFCHWYTSGASKFLMYMGAIRCVVNCEVEQPDRLTASFDFFGIFKQERRVQAV